MFDKVSTVLRCVLPFFLVRFALRLLCRVEVSGREHLREAGQRVLIVANHVSTFDAALLSAFLPGRVLFATPANIAHRWWLKPYWHIGDEYTVDQADPMTAKKMVDRLKKDQPCMIFPEGRLTRTGGLMKIYESPGMIADKAGAKILPIRIDGPQYSYFTGLDKNTRRRLFPKITIAIRPAESLSLPEEVKGHKRRLMAGALFYDLMEKSMVEGAATSTLLRQYLATRSVRGCRNPVLEDATRRPLSHDAFTTRFFALASTLDRILSKKEKTVGIMMPNVVPNGVSIFALQALDRVTAMINFTSGPKRVVEACKMAKISTVLTIRAFIETQHLEPVVEALAAARVRVLYLEDVAPKITKGDKLSAFLRARLPASLAAAGLSNDTNAPALMLFTSGTEGLPKGVMLSHKNIIANGIQSGIRMGYCAQDRMFACLPMFHSFGLTLGFFMPLFFGSRTFLYLSPLRYHEIPELVYDTGVTAILGTDTFLSNYAKCANPHDFYFMKFVVGGAEPIKPETKKVWAEKFGVRLLEGYGTTEAAPVVTINSPMYLRAGSIGRVLPAMEYKLQPVDGIANGAELVVRGPNVMLGYVHPDRPGVIQPPKDGWYNTGDVVTVDEEGFVFIKGRTKRFAKVAGEMVALPAIEAVIASLWPEARHIAVGVPSDRKGETIVLLTESDKVDLSVLPEAFRTAGLTELSLPRKIVKVGQIPLLGSGKTDYVTAKEIAIRETANEDAA
jgi:acyl-[acyl-carrier-protein]-phospholipid O-acyltransferase/long-chain-fatty-acid--[acyl-carrier-protein] ligase